MQNCILPGNNAKYTPEMDIPPGMVSIDTHNKLVTNYNELAKRYRNLKQDHAKCEQWMALYYDKYKEMKANCKAWRIYLDKHEKKFEQIDFASSPSKGTAEKRSPPRVTSSQTTEAAQESSPPTTHEPASDDVPEVISVRSIKRRRGVSPSNTNRPVYIKQEEANSPQNPIELQSEDFSSPVAKRLKPTRTETSDLDALVHHVSTPRKRRRDRGTSEEVFRPAPLPKDVSSLSEGDLDGLAQVSRNHVLGLATNVPRVKPSASTGNSDSSNYNALRPRSVNIPGAPSSADLQRMATIKRQRENRAKVAILSEDGEVDSNAVVTPKPVNANIGHLKRRLDTLLEEPTPGKQPLATRRPVPSTTPRQRQAQPLPQPPIDVDETPKAKAAPGYRSRLLLEPSPPPAQPEDEPLRLRPWQSLRLDDFRLNPKFLGADYAFADTFRGRLQRQCPPDCTKLECCGNAYRQIVEAGAMKQTKSDEELLENYLGQDFKQVLKSYSPAKQKDLLTQARTYAFANQHSKHRTAYERPRTPPGFWRTDMPTTQEAAEDRARAQEMVKQKVEDRWREAMREGGRWMFRDE